MKTTKSIEPPRIAAEPPELEATHKRDLQAIAFAWPKLSDNVRQTIRTLVAVSYPDEKDSHHDA